MAPSPSSFPSEFTPELNSQYLDALLQPINQQTEESVGNAEAQAGSRGLLGQATEGSLETGAQAYGNQQANQAVAGFDYSVANTKEQERMLEEQQGFQNQQAVQNYGFNENLAQMGYNAQTAAANQAHEWGVQGAIMGMGAGVLQGAATGAAYSLL